MDYSGKQDFQKDFYDTLKEKYRALLNEAIDLDDISPYSGLRFSQIKNKDVARIFVIPDADLRELIVKCINAGYATKTEIAELFKIKPHIMTDRVICGSNPLQLLWNARLDDISDTYPEVPIDMVHYTDKDENGKEFENGYAHNIKKLSAGGSSKTEICRLLKFNPSSYDKIPSLRKAYNEGLNLSGMMVADNVLDAIKNKVIRPRWFEEVYLPELMRQATQQKITLWDIRYTYKEVKDEETGEITIKETKASAHKREVIVPPSKHAQEIMQRLSTGNLLDGIDYDKNKDKVSEIPTLPLNTDERGNVIEVEDAEYEVE